MKINAVLCVLLALLVGAGMAADKPLKIGLIGLDTSHAPAFTKSLNDSTSPDYVPGGVVVCAFAGGSPDVEASATRVQGFTKEIHEKWNVEIVPDIPSLIAKVDAVILHSVDGRVHLQQVQPVLAAHKPVFIDKPMAASLHDVKEIFSLADKYDTPCFSSSSLRYLDAFYQALQNKTLGVVFGCDAYSPATLEPHHPDMMWYGIHGIEMLFAAMGPECQQVKRIHEDGVDIIIGQWSNGRLGQFRGIRDGHKSYGVTVFGEKGTQSFQYGTGSLYKPLLQQVMNFFRTGTSPVPQEETIAMFAFMEAADKSKNQHGQWVKIK